MGEYADLILSGDMCQFCGMMIPNGEGDPRTCKDCIEPIYKKTYVTFGYDHKHKIKDKFIDARCVAVIKCDNREHGRRLAFEIFSTQFCLEYHEEEFTTDSRHFPRGLINVN